MVYGQVWRMVPRGMARTLRTLDCVPGMFHTVKLPAESGSDSVSHTEIARRILFYQVKFAAVIVPTLTESSTFWTAGKPV
jgi:hypothetical protein